MVHSSIFWQPHKPQGFSKPHGSDYANGFADNKTQEDSQANMSGGSLTKDMPVERDAGVCKGEKRNDNKRRKGDECSFQPFGNGKLISVMPCGNRCHQPQNNSGNTGMYPRKVKTYPQYNAQHNKTAHMQKAQPMQDKYNQVNTTSNA